jgi:hypothetical protein
MIAPPERSLTEIDYLADWFELCAITEAAGEFAGAEVIDALVASGAAELKEVRALAADDEQLSSQELVSRLVENVIGTIQGRIVRWGSAYPFELDVDVLRFVKTLEDSAAYVLLLAVDLGTGYSRGVQQALTIQADSDEGRLFEKVVEASQANLFAGHTVRFGWPREATWPTHPRDRVQHLADLLGLSVNDLSELASDAKDVGLDVITVGTDPASDSQAWYAVLTQCAVGANWMGKTGQPELAEWLPMLHWKTNLFRAVAIARTAGRTYTVERIRRHFGNAIVLDRSRLLLGRPDEGLDDTTRIEIADLCRSRFTAFPPGA